MKIGRFIRTVRYLKMRQLLARVFLRLRIYRIDAPVPHACRELSRNWVSPVDKPASMTGEKDFQILNQRISISDWKKWNDDSRDKLLLYHLHYMDDLIAHDADRRTEWHVQLIEQWIDDNPVLIGNGWEPYPLSRRIVNWIKWALAGNTLSERALQSLWLQTRVLYQSIEHHLLANHIFANAKALYFAGVFFRDNEAEAWRIKGLELLKAEMAEQLLPDGAHFERSPMYHSIVLEDVLDIFNIGRSFAVELPDRLEATIEPMLRWLEGMTHPDGNLGHFNDTVAGVAPTAVELDAYAARLGHARNQSAETGLQVFPDSGYVRYDDDDLALILDIGEIGPDYQPGHAHNDCLSIELSLRGKRLLVNTGISTYNVSKQRKRERSTSAHNTVSIRSAEQSETWGAFRVGRRARPVNVTIGDNAISAGHNGWQYLGIGCERALTFEPGVLVLRDELKSARARRRRGIANFHFHPDVAVEADECEVRIGEFSMHFDNSESLTLEEYDYCAGFSRTEKATVVRIAFSDWLETTIKYANPVSH